MKHLVPQDAEHVRTLVSAAYAWSKDDFEKAHVLAPLVIVGALALSALNWLAYLSQGLYHFAAWEIDLAKSDMIASGCSFLLTALCVGLFVLGVLFPEFAFQGFAPEPVPVPMPAPVPVPAPVSSPSPPPFTPSQYEAMSENLMNASLHLGRVTVDPLLPQAPRTWSDSLKQFFVDPNHPSKVMKYRHWMNQLAEQYTHLDADIATYQSQQDPLSRAYVALLLIIRNPVGEGYQDARGQYQLFVRKLDELIASREYVDGPIKDHVQHLCLIRWAGISMTRYFGEILQLTREANSERREEPADFMQRVLHANQEVRAAPTHMKKQQTALYWQQLTATLGVKYLTGDENTPNLRGIQTWRGSSGDHRIFSVRHGCPTTAGSAAYAVTGMGLRVVSAGYLHCATGEAVAHNYSEMVRGLSQQNKSVFFTCLQRNTRDLVENEESRVQALLAEQQKHDNFFVLVQAMEGPFFDRKNRFTGMTRFADVAGELCQEFRRGRMCILPKLIQERAMDDYCNNVMPGLFQAVHQIFFAGRTDIASKEEWQSFILLCYLFQRWDLQFRLGDLSGKPVGVKTNPCKDYLDRGGATALIESMVLALILGKLDDPNWMATEMANVIGPAIAVKKKEVITKRLQLAEPVYGIVRGADVSALRNLAFCGRKVVQDQPSVLDNQEAMPSLASVRTPHELMIFLKSLCLASGWAPKRYTVEEMQPFMPKGVIQKAHIEKQLRGTHLHFNDRMTTLDGLIASCGELPALNILHYVVGNFSTEALNYVMSNFKNDATGLRCKPKQQYINIQPTAGGYLLEITFDLDFGTQEKRYCDIRIRSVVEIGQNQVAAAWNFAITNLAQESQIELPQV